MNYLIIEAILTLLFSYFLYERYAMKSISLSIKILVISVWFLTFFGIFIFPLDVYYSLIENQTNNNSLNSIEVELIKEDSNKGIKKIIYFLWNIIYWTIYVISWVVIPIYQEYEMAGDFSVAKKLKRSIRKNLYFYAVILILGSIFLVFLIIRQKFTYNHMLMFLVSTSNNWGIFLIIFLLGYGLVALPKSILTLSDNNERQRYLEWFGKETQDDINSKKEFLSLILNRLFNMKKKQENFEDENIAYIELHNIIWLEQEYIEKELLSLLETSSYDDLADLNKEIKLTKHEILRNTCELEEAFQEWDRMQSVQEKLNKNQDFNFKIQTAYKYFSKQWGLRILALQMILLSLTTILSEMTLFTRVNVSIIGMLVNSSSQSLLLVHVLTVFPLMFLFFACLFGMFNLKISGVFGMYKNNHTDATSLLLMSGFMCRIGFPLCLNFAQMIKLNNKTILEEIVGTTELDPMFGSNFFIVYPTILILLVVLNLFNVYENLIRMVGLSSHLSQNWMTNDKIKEGQIIFNKMRMDSRMRKIIINSEYSLINNDNYASSENHSSNEVDVCFGIENNI